jgi:hypothetical protein
MKRSEFAAVITFILLACGNVFALDAGGPGPFGFQIDKTSYQEAQTALNAKGWKYIEYEKKQVKEINEEDPRKGKNTFFKVTPAHTPGIKGILMFFSAESTLDAVLVSFEPHLFAAVMDSLIAKYSITEKNLSGEFFTEHYPHVLFEHGNLYIELQQYGPHQARLVYVSKLLYENYRNFLYKIYEPFRRGELKIDWMDNL